MDSTSPVVHRNVSNVSGGRSQSQHEDGGRESEQREFSPGTTATTTPDVTPFSYYFVPTILDYLLMALMGKNINCSSKCGVGANAAFRTVCTEFDGLID